ncbi:MAG: choice-of-anchor U domain-containing protein [Dehalococcoidia bacterium]|jgi:Tol biopolymer transport system component
MKKRLALVSLGVLVLMSSLYIASVLAIFGMERVSVSSSGVQGNGESDNPSISADGRYVAFQSQATNLVPDGTNYKQIFVRDRQSNATTLVSENISGSQGNGDSYNPSITADGRYVAFDSYATNLVAPATTGGNSQVFIRNLQTNITTLVSQNINGNQGNEYSNNPSISADGHYVAFQSIATDLVIGGTSGFQIFVRDRMLGTTTVASCDNSGTQGNGLSDNPSISADGRYVAFQSGATDLVTGGTSGFQIFVRDRQTNTTTLVSENITGVQGNGTSRVPSISADGRYVAFDSVATNLVTQNITGNDYQIFIRDRMLGTTTLASCDNSGTQGNGPSAGSSINADGRYIAFQSAATNLVTGGTSAFQIFVRDRQTNTTTLVSCDSSGNQGTNWSQNPSISADGRYVAFESDADNLVPGDTNGNRDIFVATLAQPTPANVTSASVNTSLGTVNFTTSAGSISGLTNLPPESMPCSSGGFIFPYGMFSYSITNLAPGATATVTITTPTAIPMGSKFFKCQNGSLTDFTQYVQQTDPNTFILTLKDGGQGDADGLANGTIIDPCGPAFTNSGPTHSSLGQVPTVAQGPAAMANIAVQSASLSTAKVAPGAPITVIANIANQGTADGSSQIKLYINGQEEAHQGVTLSSGSRTPVKFTVSRDEPGSYSVYVGSIPAGTFEVAQFADPNLILYISGALLLFALAGGVIFMATRRR